MSVSVCIDMLTSVYILIERKMGGYTPIMFK